MNPFLARVDQINQRFVQMVRQQLNRRTFVFLQHEVKPYGATFQAKNGSKYKLLAQTFPNNSVIKVEVTHPSGFTQILMEKQFLTFGTFDTFDRLVQEAIQLIVDNSK